MEEEFASLDVADIRKVRQLEEENSKLKRLVADLSLDKVMLQDLLGRKW
jgi:putative transposase